jgi:hypothetical protein
MAKLNIFKGLGKVGGGRGGLRLARIKNKGSANPCTFVHVTVHMCIFFHFRFQAPKRKKKRKSGIDTRVKTKVDFATATSQSDVRITQRMCHVMIMFHDCSAIKDKSNKNS